MLAAELTAIGPAHEVVKAIEVAAPGAPAADEIVVSLSACSINPADLLLIEGKYASLPPVPSRLGIEGVGTVEAVGADIDHLAPGDVVLSLGRTNWAHKVVLKGTQAVKLPADIDVEQAAMLKVNGATAYRMLKDYVDLAPGDWVIQDAANSGVGVNLIRLAAAAGIRTVNVVRRPELIEPLMDQGADVVVVDGPDLVQHVHDATGGAEIRLGIDAVAGSMVRRMADCLAPGGVIVNYGLLSGDPCEITADHLVFKGLSLTGFWLAKVASGMSYEEVAEMYQALAERIQDRTLAVPVEARYPLERIEEAMRHAGTYGRGGKVLLRPDR
ncbi:zinc-dependent alcohol dehydrogenase family protein [Thalassobaculum sp. OXR-137]|uniref:zinc-dependent alcohol dehydrogenase family protein n=1 Tax=Thalassobaculum sp. OXR-137 TaxID=3100173 RepID=UPI002AC9B3C7|nr:zinc-dependent alcohol dehydrogenase family protein [Thalassobaculum sp. OXR-137]WPZ32426.1 zinc-dependent alcohol dehydrogenase family protein [Thalassobaculum sp. OXR-137]